MNEVLIERAERLDKIRNNPKLLEASKIHYESNPIDFINDWMITYDPRVSPSLIPFILFPKQEDFINWILGLIEDQRSGVAEKSRDAGFTFACCAISVWFFLFKKGSKIGWGSRKEALVDKIGDPDSIFEKMRILIRYLPEEYQPIGWNEKQNASFMKIINPENGSVITGEAGDNIGRGGRNTIYFKDESAFYERPMKIEASLSQNANVKIDISTPNGSGNPFYQKRHSGKFPVFTFHWKDDKRKNHWHNPITGEKGQGREAPEGAVYPWYEHQKNELDPITLAQEVDIDYNASIDNIVIPAKWVLASVTADLGEMKGTRIGGMDVADSGKDHNALIIREASYIKEVFEWDSENTTVGARMAFLHCQRNNTKYLSFDSIGVGAGIKGEMSVIEEKHDFVSFPVNVAESPTDRLFKGGKKGKELFANLRAELWWTLREKFEKTYEHFNGIKHHDPDDMISIPNDTQLISECSRPLFKINNSGKILIESKEEMKKRGIASPNRVEALLMSYANNPSDALNYDELLSGM